MLDQVLRPLLQRHQIFLRIRIRQRLPRRHLRSTPMHLQRPRRRHNDNRVRRKARNSALNVAELLHAHIRTESTLSQDIANTVGRITLLRTRKLQRHPVRQDRRVSMRDVRERPSMHKHRRSLQRLHQIRLHRILHQHRQRTSHPNIIRRNRIPTLTRRHHHRTQLLPHIRQTGGQSEDSHTLARDGDVEAGDALVALFGRILADGDLAEMAVVRVEDAVPGDGGGVDVETGETGDFFGGELVRVGFGDTELLEAFEHERGELALALLGGYETAIQGLGYEIECYSLVRR